MVQSFESFERRNDAARARGAAVVVERPQSTARPTGFSRAMPGAPVESTPRYPDAPDLAGRRVDGIDAARLDAAIERSVARVRALQVVEPRPSDAGVIEGHWVGELEANAVLNAEYIFTHHYIGMLDHPRVAKLARRLIATQRDDGSWPIHFLGAGDRDATIESYAALKLAGYPADHPALVKARAFIHAKGGLIAARMITRIYLALMGEFPWEGTPGMPAQAIFLPAWAKMNIYDMSYWARTCTVPLLVLCTLKRERLVPEGRGVAELFLRKPTMDELSFKTDRGFFSWPSLFIKLDKLIKIAQRGPVKITEGAALRACERWIREHQDAPGDWGGILPAMTHSIMALSALGHGTDDPGIRRGMEALCRLELDAEDGIRIQPCVSPVWDTAWCLMALEEAGIGRDDPAISRSLDWMYRMQITRKGDWAVKCPDVPAGGWAFQYANDHYPDIDDTSVVLMALLRAGFENEREVARFDLGARWMLGLQNRDGGFGAFEQGNDDVTWNAIPFNDAGNMLDPSTADVSGRVIEFLGRAGRRWDDPTVKPTLDYLLSEQEEDGKWWGRWGVNYVYGTWSVLAGLHTVGLPPTHDAMVRGAAWLESYRNADGGFGESCESYIRTGEKGPSTPSQTAWAILGLVAAGRARGDVARDAVQWLIDRQKDDGDWDEEAFTGNGFPGVFYLRYHMYRLYFPLLALCRWRSAVAGT